MEHATFEERYQAGQTPWDHGMVDFNLIQAVEHFAIKPCRAFDVGCGTGDNSFWLAKQGFEVTACDLSKTAIQRAEEKATAQAVKINYYVADFLTDTVVGLPVDFVFDRGCLHCFKAAGDCGRFAEKVALLLNAGGLWLSLVGNANEPKREVGPPQLSATELVSVVDPYFEILSLTETLFGSDQEVPPRAWACLMRRRGERRGGLGLMQQSDTQHPAESRQITVL